MGTTLNIINPTFKQNIVITYYQQLLCSVQVSTTIFICYFNGQKTNIKDYPCPA